MSKQCIIASAADILPLCDCPRTTLGAPASVYMPLALAPFAISKVMGNSLIVAPKLCTKSTFSSVSSSCEAMAIWLALAKAASS